MPHKNRILLAGRRKAIGLWQADLAHRLEIGISTLRRYERAERVPAWLDLAMQHLEREHAQQKLRLERQKRSEQAEKRRDERFLQDRAEHERLGGNPDRRRKGSGERAIALATTKELLEKIRKERPPSK
jgi:hypothetical protein